MQSESLECVCLHLKLLIQYLMSSSNIVPYSLSSLKGSMCSQFQYTHRRLWDCWLKMLGVLPADMCPESWYDSTMHMLWESAPAEVFLGHVSASTKWACMSLQGIPGMYFTLPFPVSANVPWESLLSTHTSSSHTYIDTGI